MKEDIEIDLDNDMIDIELENSNTIHIGSTNYEKLKNKPQINNIMLTGNLTNEQLNLQEKGDYANSKLTNAELEKIFNDWN